MTYLQNTSESLHWYGDNGKKCPDDSKYVLIDVLRIDRYRNKIQEDASHVRVLGICTGCCRCWQHEQINHGDI